MRIRFFCSLLLSSVLVFCISARDVVKREAPEGRFYVHSSLEGCSAVQSKDPCPVNWSLPSFFAKTYEAQNNLVEALLKMQVTLSSVDGIAIGEKCQADAKAVLCSQRTPRCTQDLREDFGDTKVLCDKVKASCPETFGKEICDDLLSGVQSKKECATLTKPIEGVCPQPKYKRPAEELKQYQKISKQFEGLSNNLKKIGFSEDCSSKMKNMFCRPLACSADEKRLLVKHDRDDCINVVKSCFTKSTWSPQPIVNEFVENFKEMFESSCGIYPKGNTSSTEAAPPTVKPVSAAACNLPQFLLFFVCLFFMFVA